MYTELTPSHCESKTEWDICVIFSGIPSFFPDWALLGPRTLRKSIVSSALEVSKEKIRWNVFLGGETETVHVRIDKTEISTIYEKCTSRNRLSRNAISPRNGKQFHFLSGGENKAKGFIRPRPFLTSIPALSVVWKKKKASHGAVSHHGQSEFIWIRMAAHKSGTSWHFAVRTTQAHLLWHTKSRSVRARVKKREAPNKLAR